MITPKYNLCYDLLQFFTLSFYNSYDNDNSMSPIKDTCVI